MSDYLTYPLLGLANGAVFAALAVALVVSFRSSNVLNIATGALALYGAYTYAYLREGELVVPFAGPATVSVGGQVPSAAAFVGAVGAVALLGTALQAAVFRPLRHSSDLAKAVASIGVMVTLQATLAVRLGTSPVSTSPIFPTGVLEVGAVRLRVEVLWFAGAVVVLVAVLWIAERRSRFGIVSRAVAESEKGALVTGLSPQRVALASAAVSASVAGIAGILIVPLVPVFPAAFTLFIVPALAAAVVAGFSSLPVALAAGFGIGMVGSELDYLVTKVSWLPETGRGELIPLALVLVYLVARGQPMPGRGAIVTRRLGRAPRASHVRITATVGLLSGLLVLGLTHGNARGAVVTSMIMGVIALSLVVVTGLAGQVSFAQLTLAGVGAFSLSVLSDRWGVPFPIAPLLAALASAVVGVVVGLPALRVRALSVAVVTMALATALEAGWFRNPDLNGGLQGARVPAPALFGVDLGVGSGRNYPRLPFAILCLSVLVLASVGVALLRRSRLGLSMLAVRASERSAAASGIDVGRTKLVAFAIASFLAGLGGSLLAYRQTLVTADSFGALAGLGFFATAYLAGVTSVFGALVAGALAAGGLVFFVADDATGLGRWYDAAAGLGLVLIVMLNPEGLVKPVHDLAARLRRSDTPHAPVTDAAPESRRVPFLRPAQDHSPGPLLSLQCVRVAYGPIIPVRDVSVDISAGGIVGLVGPNGAGKTTLIDAISGFAPTTGSIRLDGCDISALRPHRRSDLGIARTFQGVDLYEDLSVEENLAVGARSAIAASDTLQLLRLEHLRDRPAQRLSQGERQLVSVGRALMRSPRLLLLDEPAAGLDSLESRWLGERLAEVANAGVTVVLVDHDLDLVFAICQRVVVLNLGEVIADGPAEAVRDDPAVQASYLGGAPMARRSA